MSFPTSKRVLVYAAMASSIVVLVALLLPASGMALPNYSTATGQACAACHVNPAGGGALTANGQAFAAILTHGADPVAAWSQVTQAAPAATAAPAAAQGPESIAKGGRLYDSWWDENKIVAPAGNQPLWSSQSTNTRTGTTTWRCKECHGWDYKGKDGAYGSGSHKTGFPGVFEAGSSKAAADLAAAINGTANPQHDFSAIGEASVGSLVDFLKNGLLDMSKYIDYASKKPIGADNARGQALYGSDCSSCHGADGRTLNFGSSEQPEYVGTIAVDNPWEFLHKVWYGQPGSNMPSALVVGWSVQDVVDVLGYAQTLPVAAPTPAATPPAATPTAAPPPAAAPAPAATPTTLPRTGEPGTTTFALWFGLAGLAVVATGLVSRRYLRNRS